MPDGHSDERCITVNAGGTRYTTTLSTLLSHENSYFTRILSGDWNDKAQAELFVDRYGEMFKHVLRFLRASPQGKLNLVQSLSIADRVVLAEEANFFQLGNLSHLLESSNQKQPNMQGQHARVQLCQACWWTYNPDKPSNARENAKTAVLLLQGCEILHSSFEYGIITFLLASPG